MWCKYIFIFIVYSVMLGYYCKWGGYKLGYEDSDRDRICENCKNIKGDESFQFLDSCH